MSCISGVEITRGRIEIRVDGVAVLRLPKAHFQKCPVHEGDEIDLEEYTGRIAKVQFPDAYEAALTSLESCARTRREIENALRRRGYVEPVITTVVEKLGENRLLDDARYAQRMAELQSKKPMGVYAFKRKLHAKGISDDDACEALDAFDDEQQQAACRAAAESLIRKYASLPPREGRAKLSQALARRGFTWDAIQSATEDLFE